MAVNRQNRRTSIHTDTNISAGDHYLLLVDASGGAVTVTLPEISTRYGSFIIVKKTDSSTNVVTVEGFGGTETIDDDTTQDLVAAYEAIQLYADASTKANGPQWRVT